MPFDARKEQLLLFQRPACRPPRLRCRLKERRAGHSSPPPTGPHVYRLPFLAITYDTAADMRHYAAKRDRWPRAAATAPKCSDMRRTRRDARTRHTFRMILPLAMPSRSRVPHAAAGAPAARGLGE